MAQISTATTRLIEATSALATAPTSPGAIAPIPIPAIIARATQSVR